MDWLIVGLGNPGPSYEGHRHNVGFSAIQALAEAFSAGPFQKRDRVVYSLGVSEGQRIGLAMPYAYMNLSGKAVSPLIHFYKMPLERVLVIHDDLDIPVGALRFKRGGGAGGHRGLRDIDAHVGNAYARIRLGIGHPGHKSMVSSYVLHPFASEEMPLIAKAQETIVHTLPLLFSGQEDIFKQQIRL